MSFSIDEQAQMQGLARGLWEQFHLQLKGSVSYADCMRSGINHTIRVGWPYSPGGMVEFTVFQDYRMVWDDVIQQFCDDVRIRMAQDKAVFSAS
jgi:hypothetical protein